MKAGTIIIHILQEMDPKLGDIDFLEVKWLVRAEPRLELSQGGRTPDLELLTTSSSASLFHLSGTLSFTHFSPPLALFFIWAVLKQTFSTWQQGRPQQLWVCRIPSIFAFQKDTRYSNGPGEGSAVSSQHSAHQQCSCCVSTVESISSSLASEVVSSDQPNVTEVTFWDF